MPRAVPPNRSRDRFLYRKKANQEPFPGYRLLEPLGHGGFGEVWKCEAPGGLLKAIKFVRGDAPALDQPGTAPADEELRAIEQVKAIRHPFLLSMERVESVGGELVIVLELADQSLQDLLAEYRRAGQPGIPREELLGYLRETAEALDLMNLKHGLQHLDIKPRNLFLVSNHVKVGDFGLVSSLNRGSGSRDGQPLGAITPLYASPEVFQGAISRHSDQYSLAVVYQELLTGALPFHGKNARQLLLQHSKEEPDLGPLPEADRPAVARALSKKPEERFPSCADFVRALAAGPGGRPEEVRETVRLAGRKTEPPGRPAGRAAANGEVVAGHRLVRCQHCTPLTEVWEAEGPGGVKKVVKFVYGFAPRAGDPGADAVARLEALRHPALVPVEILHSAPGRLVLAAPVAEKTLRQRWQEAQAQGLAGIPRAELLGHLREAAGALDFLYQRHGLQHLGLNPRNLLLDGGRLRIADFGLAQLVWLPAGQPVARLNARYAPPAVRENRAEPGGDQYSLALVYHELLTGTHADRRPAAGPPALDRLPPGDRVAVARALDPDPRRRWPSCLDFVRALEAGGSAAPGPGSGLEAANAPAPAPPAETPAGPPSGEWEGEVLKARFNAGLPAGGLQGRLDAFRTQWRAEPAGRGPDEFVFHMRTPRSFWQRWIGRRPGLEIHVRVAAAPGQGADVTEVTVAIRPRDCGRKQSADLLKVIGPLLLESLRNYLQVSPRRRSQERLAWCHPLQACPVGPDGRIGEPINCKGKDISLNGIAFYLPRELPTTQVRLHLPETPQTPKMTIPARVVRLQGCGNGWYEAGAVLLAPALADAPRKGQDRRGAR